ncbi:MAG: hypothetical protein ACYCTV_11460 [Leptospirales bacterium]
MAIGEGDRHGVLADQMPDPLRMTALSSFKVSAHPGLSGSIPSNQRASTIA